VIPYGSMMAGECAVAESQMNVREQEGSPTGGPSFFCFQVSRGNATF
jgi:hypothetical protein